MGVKKPGFFTKILRYSQNGKKPGFFDIDASPTEI
jgi:hypothetical protein